MVDGCYVLARGTINWRFPVPPIVNGRAPVRAPKGLTADLRSQRRKSEHFSTSFAPGPQGSTGTLDVEFFGEPSTSLSL